MFQFPSARGDRTLHFKNLNRYTQGHGDNPRWMIGKFWEIDEEIYSEFENMLPPLYWEGLSCFRMCERLTDDVAATFFKVGNRYWCGFTDLTVTSPARMLKTLRRQ